MGAIVEAWVGKLSKLREKVLPISSNPLFSKSKQAIDQNNKDNVGVPLRDTSASHSMSEKTVFLLMDRFVPW
ncbi:hypothetical protein MtrunA17_Chr4g0034091 [Medicago truncatula]|uniref:Uncharacterized protein n=1 Tax=Medicago truncatula TaxID=3880 RepID=A0A072UX01_MEDTR|nr:hypothetical protein MTR_4g068453 [Medicago truncatula]RHN61206.1 hypothetical protein MtrunA17_Chr4g0034091 [Medicago truncatula]